MKAQVTRLVKKDAIFSVECVGFAGLMESSFPGEWEVICAEDLKHQSSGSPPKDFATMMEIIIEEGSCNNL